jgi:glutaredoxin
MVKMKLFIFLFLIFIFLIGCAPKTSKYDSFALCLFEKDATMYGTEWCSHCKNQKSLFGSAFKHVNYVDCDIDRDECLRAGVNGYPTWIINGKPYEGEQPLDRLSRLTGCELPN